jgi:protein TonB
MTTLGMNYGYESRDPTRRIKGLVIVIALHALLGYALVSGMARKGLDLIKKPLEAVVIQEVIIPPPPPPPPPKEIKSPEPKAPKVDAPPPFVPPPEVVVPVVAAPAIEATIVVPVEPVVIAPPPPPLPAPVTGPARNDIGVACPTQVQPDMPRKALQDGIQGVVRAQVLIKDGAVKEVTILSGPRIFHSAVRSAMLQYKCTQDAGDVVATQEFNFKVE